MMKLAMSIIVFLSAAMAMAENNKIGTVILNGQSLNVSIQERGASGVIAVGKQTFKVISGGSQGVEGVLRETVNGKATKDLNILIKFQIFSEQEIQQIVDNKNEVKCTAGANAIILISNNINGAAIGNCLNLKDR